MYRWVILDETPPEAPANVTVVNGSRNLEVTWGRANDAPFFDEPGSPSETATMQSYLVEYTLRRDSGTQFFDQPLFDTEDDDYIGANSVTVTNARSVILDNLVPRATYHVRVTPTDRAGNVGVASRLFTVPPPSDKWYPWLPRIKAPSGFQTKMIGHAKIRPKQNLFISRGRSIRFLFPDWVKTPPKFHFSM